MYAIRSYYEATGRQRSAKAAVADVLELHETDRSDDAPDSAAVGLKPMSDPDRPAGSRTVLLSGSTPVGVIPSSADLPRMEEAMEEAPPPPAPESPRVPKRRAAARRATMRKRGGGGGGGRGRGPATGSYNFV